MIYAAILGKLAQLTPQLGGVLSTADLSSIVRSGSDLQNQRAIKKMIREDVLFRVRKGLYTTKSPSLEILAARLNEKAYLSMDTVLAKNGLIGTVPLGSVSAVSIKRGKAIKAVSGLVRFFQIRPSLMFGYARSKEGLWIADSEKAFLDLLYFYVKGARFVIDPTQEVITRRLDRSRIAKYLRAYKNPKFVRFVKNLISLREDA